MKNKILIVLGLIFFASCHSPSQKPKYGVKVLIVNFFENGNATGDKAGEQQLWVENEKLDKEIEFKQGVAPLRYNPKTQVLELLTGMGTLNSTVSMMGLGMDSRFDLSKAYIVLAGIAGGDPEDTTLGSAVWARYVLDADLKHSLDPREMPKGWKTGNFPFLKHKPNAKPVAVLGSEFFQINENLLQFAYKLTKDIKIPETSKMKEKRSWYKNYPNAQRSPFVMIGDNLDGQNFWHGKLTNDWANSWMKYYTKGKGNFVTTAMEDTGVLNAIQRLGKLGLVDPQRVLVLRAVSNFDMQWQGASAYDSFMGEKSEGYSALDSSIKACYLVGSKVVHELLDHWSQFKDSLPQ